MHCKTLLWLNFESDRVLSNELLWRRLDWNLIRIFHEIVECGGVSAAARSLGRQQPAMSQALSRLEEQLGATLCERGPSGFALTPEGEIVFSISQKMVELMRDAPNLLAQAAGEIRGSLKLWIMSAIRSAQFDQVLTAIARRHRFLDVSIQVADWEDILDAVQSGDADIGLTYTSAIDVSLIHEPIFSETQQLFCSMRHGLYGQQFADPRKLSGEVFFLTGRDEPLELKNFRKRYGLGNNSRGGSEDLNELKRLIMTGAAIGFLPQQVVEDDVRNRTLWPLLKPSVLPSYPVYVVSKPQAHRSLSAQLFSDEARRLLAALDTREKH